MKKNIYYTVMQVIKILGISRGTLYRWERAGKLPKPKREKVSNNRYYTRGDINILKSIFGTGRETQ